MKSPTPESRLLMSGVMAVTAPYAAGVPVMPKIEGPLRVPAQIANETPAQTAYRQAWEQRLEEAHEGRRALAGRYAGCAVTEVVDTHSSRYIEGTEHVPRNEVIVTVKAGITPAAEAAEATYNTGQPRAHDVQWFRFGGGGYAQTQRRYRSTGEKVMLDIPTASKSVESAPGQETFTIKFYPRVDQRLRTTNAAISLQTEARTSLDGGEPGLKDDRTYISTGTIICGRLVEAVGADGQTEWRAPMGPDPELGVRAIEQELCEFVPVGDSGSMYDEQCN